MAPPHHDHDEDEDDDDDDSNGIPQAETDKKQYEIVQLKNGLRCLLISDMTHTEEEIHHRFDEEIEEEEEEEESASNDASEEEEEEHNDEEDDDDCGPSPIMCAVSMAVKVGSFHELEEPDTPCGLAHYLEHLLFMGSKKYPVENAYDSFVSSRGGYSNAFTDTEVTVYYFEIPQKSLHEAMDIFAQFFISPLFLEDTCEREREAVNSEFELSRSDDEERLGEILYSHCKQPYSRFTCGNNETLKVEGVLERLKRFHARHYFAENMSLCVWALEPMESLRAEVETVFGGVPSNGRAAIVLPPTPAYDPLIPSLNRGVAHFVVPVVDVHLLRLTWSAPSLIGSRYPQRRAAHEYYSHLLGHEGVGSLYYELKRAGLVSQLTCGHDETDGHDCSRLCSLFPLDLALTLEGARAWERVVEAVFRYLGVLEREPPHRWIFNEISAISETMFRFKEQGDPAEEVVELGCLLARGDVKDKDLLRYKYTAFEWDEEEIASFLREVLLQSLPRIDLLSSTLGREEDFIKNPDFRSPLATASGPPSTDPIYGARYWTIPLPTPLLKAWEERTTAGEFSFRLPPPNPFIASDFEFKNVLPQDQQRPHHPLVGAVLELPLSSLSHPNGAHERGSDDVDDARTTSQKKKKKGNKPHERSSSEVTRIEIVKIASSNPLVFTVKDLEDVLDSRPKPLPATAMISPISSLNETYLATEVNPSRIAQLIMAAPESLLPNVRLLAPPLPVVPRDVLATSNATPAAARESPTSRKSSRLFFLPDHQFLTPRGALFLLIRDPGVRRSAAARAGAELSCRVAAHALTDVAYNAHLANVDVGLRADDEGFVLAVTGFSHKLLDVGTAALDELKRVLLPARNTDKKEVDDEEVAARVERETLAREYKNADSAPDRQASYTRLSCLVRDFHPSWELSEALLSSSAAADDMYRLTSSSSYTLDCFVHGNLSQDDAKAWYKRVVSRFPLASPTISLPPPRRDPLRLPPATGRGKRHLLVRPSLLHAEKNDSVHYYFQLGEDVPEARAMGELLSSVLEEPTFDELRTKQQIGYSVSCGLRRTHGVLGFSLDLTSSKFDCAEVTRRAEAFLRETASDLINELEGSEARDYAVSAAEKLLQKEPGMFSLSRRHWAEILEDRLDFDDHVAVAHHLISLPSSSSRKRETLDARRASALKAFFAKHFVNEVKCLCVWVVGGGRTVEETLARMGEEERKRYRVHHSREEFWEAM